MPFNYRKLGISLVLCVITLFSIFWSLDHVAGATLATQVTTRLQNPLTATHSPSLLATRTLPVLSPPNTGPDVTTLFTEKAGDSINQDPAVTNMLVVIDGTVNSRAAHWASRTINLTNPFTLKGSVYLAGIAGSTAVADGLTFTLRAPESTNLGASGESLGAYGVMRNAASYAGYITHAFSLEFDAFYNGDASDNKSGMTGPHIAYVRPNDATKYVTTGYTMNHITPLAVPTLTNGTWMPFTFTYTPNNTTRQATIRFTLTNGATTYTMPAYQLNLDTQFGVGQDEAVWGFTAASGQNALTAAVAFTELPQTVQVSKTIRNVTQGETTGTTATEAGFGDKLAFNYTLTNTGSEKMDNIKINETLPPYLTTIDGKSVISAAFPALDVNETKSLVIPVVYSKVPADPPLTITSQSTITGTWASSLTPFSQLSNAVSITLDFAAINPKITIVETLKNLTNPDETDTTTSLNNLAIGQQISYTATLKNTATILSGLGQGRYTMPIPINTEVNSVTLNGVALTSSQWSYVPVNATTRSVVIQDIQFSDSQTTNTVVLKLDITGKNDDLTSTSTLTGYTPNNTAYTVSGNAVTLNFNNGSIIMTPANIEFGTVVLPWNDTLLTPIPSTVPVLQVEDTRSNRAPVQVLVTQTSQFMDQTDPTNALLALPLQLRYYRSAADYQLLELDNPVLVATTVQDEILKDIQWNDSTGIRLFVKADTARVGRFSTTLDWIIIEAP